MIETIKQLYRLRDSDPEKALKLEGKLGNSSKELATSAVILIDCGGVLGNSDAVSNGIEKLNQLAKSEYLTVENEYNLANGLQLRARLTNDEKSAYTGAAFEDRFQSRVHFGNIIRNEDASNQLKSQMLTNIGILLLETHRWIEAVDFFQHARELFPKNGVSAFQEMRRLMGLANLFLDRQDLYRTYSHLDTTVARVDELANLVSTNYDIVEEFSGPAALAEVEKIVEHVLANKNTPAPSEVTPSYIDNSYFSFVQKNNLALSLHCSLDEFQFGRFDLLNIPSIQVSKEEGHNVPEIFAMMNVMKADFAFARETFFNSSLNERAALQYETASYNDTLDYSLYGVRYAALTIAQRVSLDILDKIAVAIACYFNIPKAHKMDFKNIWGSKKKGGKFTLSQPIEAQLSNGNQGLIALYNIFHDVSKDLNNASGFLEPHKHHRNASTHRFTILHDMGEREGPSASKSIEHQNVEDFRRLTMATLKLSRAALFYFVDTIIFSEEKIKEEEKDEKLALTLNVPNHDHIRGKVI